MRLYVTIFLLVTLATGATYSISTGVQSKTKRTISEIHFHSKWISHPLKYSNLKIRGKKAEFSSMFEEGNEKLEKPLKPQEEFEEEDDFWKYITFDVTNISDKAIAYLRTNVYLYTKEGVQDGSSQVRMAIEFGGYPNLTESIKPGESKTFNIPEYQLNYALPKVWELTSSIVRVGIFARDIYFEDGSNWSFDGKIFPKRLNKIEQKNQSGFLKRVSDPNIPLNTNMGKEAYKEAYTKAGTARLLTRASVSLSKNPNYLFHLPSLLDNSRSANIMPANNRPSFDGPCPIGCYTNAGGGQHSCEEVDPNSTCTAFRTLWNPADIQNPPPDGWVIKDAPPLLCKFPNQPPGTWCTIFTKACDPDRKCRRSDDEQSDYCGFGASCNPTFAQLANCNGSWDCSSCECLWGSPILIDIEGNGFTLTSGANGVDFDIQGNGQKLRWAWTANNSDDAWLALDRNGNGKIDNGAELFGNWAPQPTPPTGEEKNGFLALAVFDTPENGGNSDRKIDRRDSIFYRLKLWQDKDHNGISGQRELHTLSELGVEVIDLDYRQWGWSDQYGNLFKYRAKVRDANGAQVGRWAYDIFLTRGR